MDLTQPGQDDHNTSAGRGHADPIGDPSVSASDRYACHSSEGHLPKSHHGSFCGGSSAPLDISHIYVYVHNHWVECITSSYYGQLHGHSEREIMLASAELREQNRESHVRTPIDAKRLADFLAKIEAYEAVLLQRQRDIENQIVVYHIEQKSAEVANTPQPVLQEMLNSHRANDATLSRFAPVDLTTLQVYEEFR